MADDPEWSKERLLEEIERANTRTTWYSAVVLVLVLAAWTLFAVFTHGCSLYTGNAVLDQPNNGPTIVGTKPDPNDAGDD